MVYRVAQISGVQADDRYYAVRGETEMDCVCKVIRMELLASADDSDDEIRAEIAELPEERNEASGVRLYNVGGGDYLVTLIDPNALPRLK